MTQTFRDPRRHAHKGSLFASVQIFVQQMQAHGYAAASVKIATRLVNDFTSWLDHRGIEGHRLSATLVADYLEDRWLQRRRHRSDAFTLHTFARLVAPDSFKASSEQQVAISPARRARQEFEQYLLDERGLAAASIRLYGDSVGRFLDNAFGDAQVRLGELTATDVIRFVQVEAARLHHPKRAPGHDHGLALVPAVRALPRRDRRRLAYLRADGGELVDGRDSQVNIARTSAKPARAVRPTQCHRPS